MELDFNAIGLRAMDWMAGKKDWREFYRFKESFGVGTHYFSAKLNDPEIAEELAKQKKKTGPPPPPAPEGFGPLRHDLADIKDLISMLAAGMSGGGQTTVLTPRPQFEYEKIRERISKKKINRMLGMLLPHENHGSEDDD